MARERIVSNFVFTGLLSLAILVASGVIHSQEIRASEDAIMVFEAVPSQDSDTFRENLYPDVEVEQTYRVYDRTPYHVTPSFSKTLVFQNDDLVLLAGDREGSSGFIVDNFLLIEIGAGEKVTRFVHGGDYLRGPVFFRGQELKQLHGSPLNLTPHLALGRPITLRISALDIGGLGQVSKIFLVVKHETGSATIDLSGNWESQYNWDSTGPKVGPAVCLRQTGNKVSGTYVWASEGREKRGEITESELDGYRLAYTYSEEPYDEETDCTSGEGFFDIAPDSFSMSGSYRCGGRTGEWELTRASTDVPGLCEQLVEEANAADCVPSIKLVLDYSNDFHADKQPGATPTRYPSDLSVSDLYIMTGDGSFQKIGTMSDDTPYDAVQIQDDPPLWRIVERDDDGDVADPPGNGWTRHSFDIAEHVGNSGTYHFQWKYVHGRDTGHVRNFHVEVNGKRWYDRERGAEEGNARDGDGPAKDGGEYVDHYVRLEVPDHEDCLETAESPTIDATLPDIVSIEILDAETTGDGVKEIAIGQSFRVRLTYEEPADADFTETVTVKTSGGVTTPVKVKVEANTKVAESAPILVRPISP